MVKAVKRNGKVFWGLSLAGFGACLFLHSPQALTETAQRDITPPRPVAESQAASPNPLVEVPPLAPPPIHPFKGKSYLDLTLEILGAGQNMAMNFTADVKAGTAPSNKPPFFCRLPKK